ncbi:unnamed protein product [Lactuca virosa]|uniref:Uncharacterized protein n=1 Tax=Lactuca virosa TaxID=75947 RepID=A0AAU9LZG8_9ASTR|nr:unnamed protein product [Lactuca virosa]
MSFLCPHTSITTATSFSHPHPTDSCHPLTIAPSQKFQDHRNSNPSLHHRQYRLPPPSSSSPVTTTLITVATILRHRPQFFLNNHSPKLNLNHSATSAATPSGINVTTVSNPTIMVDDQIFPKLNWTSSKHSAWISPTGILKCTSFTKISFLLKSSDSLVHDLCHAYDLCNDCNAPRPDRFYLTLRKWYPSLHPEMEFRCFVRNRILKISSEQSFSYGGFKVSDLDIPTDYELHAMETPVQIEEMRDDIRQQLGEFREEICYLKKIVTVMVVVRVAVMSLIGVRGCVEFSGWGFWWV